MNQTYLLEKNNLAKKKKARENKGNQAVPYRTGTGREARYLSVSTE